MTELENGRLRKVSPDVVEDIIAERVSGEKILTSEIADRALLVLAILPVGLDKADVLVLDSLPPPSPDDPQIHGAPPDTAGVSAPCYLCKANVH